MGRKWGWEDEGRTMEGEEGRGREGHGRTGEGEDEGRTMEGRWKGRKDERRIRERGSRFLWDNSKRIVYKFFMGC